MRPLAPEILYPADTIQRRVTELARRITADTPAGGEIAALVVLKGAFIFGADLLRQVDRPTRVGFLESHKDPQRPGQADLVFTHPFAIEGSDLLVIEDILDTGQTMKHLLSRLWARRPARLRVAVLLDKKPRRQVEVAIDYAGFEIPDVWVVGYGLDDDERYRNLPHIGYVVE
ncbi:MAG: hypoxanthine phosphoribosyltransferase [Acidobacteria bacterium]|nr:hypoxanthine phosphoribosyltransferase [Acidobacteriota bacterium]